MKKHLSNWNDINLPERVKQQNLSSNLGGRGGSEGLDPLVGSGLVWLSEVFLRAGDGGF